MEREKSQKKAASFNTMPTKFSGYSPIGESTRSNYWYQINATKIMMCISLLGMSIPLFRLIAGAREEMALTATAPALAFGALCRLPSSSNTIDSSFTTYTTSLETLRTPSLEETFSINSLSECPPLPYVAAFSFDGRREGANPILGFGGSFTESAALNYFSLSPAGREAVLDIFFGEDGLGYNLARTHINSCDFSVENYAFDDIDGDFTLEFFDTEVTHDKQAMLPFMRSSISKLLDGWGDDLHIIASPWSPPAWMKKTGQMNGSEDEECLKNGDEYRETWALYFSKFIEAYGKQGVNIWGVTIQNEPEFSAPWEACRHTSDFELDFVERFLGPVLRRDHPNLKILSFDHNKDHLVTYSEKLINSTFIDGIGYHWYAGGMDRLLDGGVGTPNLHKLAARMSMHASSSSKIFLQTEGCHCPSTGYAGGDVNVAWSRAERYGHAILADLSAGSSGWIEWNLMLDRFGGPNHVGNVCDAPVLAIPHRATVSPSSSSTPSFSPPYPPTPPNTFSSAQGDSYSFETLHNVFGAKKEHLEVGVFVQPLYHMMSHFSRHLRPGSTAVEGSLSYEISGNHKSDSINLNQLARPGIEATFHPCDRSSRQTWLLDSVQRHISIAGVDMGIGVRACLGRDVDQAFGGLVLVGCESGEVGVFRERSDGQIKVVGSDSDSDSDSDEDGCLVVTELETGIEGGSQLGIGACDGSMHTVRLTGENEQTLYSEHFDLCLTSGWPFLQVGGFLTEDKTLTTLVILNEADTEVDVRLDEIGAVLQMPPHSVKTIRYNTKNPSFL